MPKCICGKQPNCNLQHTDKFKCLQKIENMTPITKEQFDDFEQVLKDCTRELINKQNSLDHMDDYAIQQFIINYLAQGNYVICYIS